MTETEGNTQQKIGELVLEELTLEKQIFVLRDELSSRARIFARIGKLLLLRPEFLVFEGQTVGDEFGGESAIDRKSLDVDSLIADLRAAIVRKKACAAELVTFGIDPDEAERERNLRASRNLHHPANTGYLSEGGTMNELPPIGFHKSRKRSNES